MPITPANRDVLRERAFAMSARGIGVRAIARELQINKDTAARLVREERQRRSWDRDAEEEVRRAIASLRIVLDDLWKQWNNVQGDGPHAGYAKAKLAEAIRRVHRDLVGLYGVVLPETDGERILEDRMMKMMNQPLPEGFPEVGEQAAIERHIEEMGSEYMSVGWRDTLGSQGDPYEGY